jgi:uncharacterized protein (TIGR00369 family)
VHCGGRAAGGTDVARRCGGRHARPPQPPPGRDDATIEAKTNFLAAVREGSVTARAGPVHVGRRTIVVQVDVTDDAGRLVSRTLQTQAVIEGDGG